MPRDLAALYATGKREDVEKGFDIASFRRQLPIRIGFLLANRDNLLNSEAVLLLESIGMPIPPAACVYAKQLLKAKKNNIPSSLSPKELTFK